MLNDMTMPGVFPGIRPLHTEDTMNTLMSRIRELVCELTEDENSRSIYAAKFYELATESQRKAGAANKGKTSPARKRAAQLNGQQGGTPPRYLVLEPSEKRKLDRLSGKERNILLKRELMTCQEIADELGISRQAVNKMEKRALKNLLEGAHD